MKSAAAFLALTAVAGSIFFSEQDAFSDDFLQGKIEQSLHTRVMRPGLPSKPLGEPLDHVSGKGANRKAKFEMTKSSVADFLDKNSFSLDLSASSAAPESGVDKKNDEFGNDKVAEDRQQRIAWEEWHKNVTAAIFRYWESYGNIAGEAKVNIVISKDGDVSFSMKEFHVSPADQISFEQDKLFERTIERTLQMVEHGSVLSFPPASRRDKVSWETSFSLSNDGFGQSGYSWKKNDYEDVRVPAGR